MKLKLKINYSSFVLMFTMLLSYLLVRNMHTPVERFYERQEIVTKIPKILHMTCKDKRNMSDFYKTNYNSWKKYHPDWEINLYDDYDLYNEMKGTEFEPYSESYNKIIYKVDIFKMHLLSKYGGVYVDMDVECLKPLDPLIDNTGNNNNNGNQLIFGYGPYEHNNGPYKNIKLVECAIMMSVPGHRFWKEFIIPNLKKRGECKGHAVECTGPVFITNTITQFQKKYGNKGQNGGLNIMEPIYFYPVNNQNKNRIPKEFIQKTKKMLESRKFPNESYCVHYFDGAWWDKSAKGNK